MENKKREIIELTSFEIAPILDEWAQESDDEYLEEDGEGYKPGIWDDFIKIDEDDTYYSMEDCYTNLRVIVQRKSDDKYFEGSYTIYTYSDNEYNSTLTEVFPTEKTIIVYE